MNIDLLTKLVKLANNNPNENEANLAARKVCKIIEEGEFKFVEDKPIISNRQINSDTVIYDDIVDILNSFYKTGKWEGYIKYK